MRVNTKNAESLAPEAMDVEVSETDIRSVELAEARKFLKVALAAMVVAFVTLFMDNNVSKSLFVAGYIGSLLASVFGVSKAARALNVGFPMRILFLFLALTPLFNMIPVAYFFGRSKQEAGPSKDDQRRQALIDAAKRRASQRARGDDTTQPAKAPAPAPSRAPDLQSLDFTMEKPSRVGGQAQPVAEADQRLRERLSTAIPRIRTVTETGVPDGTPLRMQMVLPPGVDSSQVSVPAMRATGGIFGVQYMIDEGAHYIAVAVSELEQVGMKLDELHQMAMRNLRKMVTSGQPGLKLRRLNRVDAKAQAVQVTLDGENEASLVLLDDLWDKAFVKYIPNGVMAVIPARGVCVFIDMASVTQGGLGDLMEVVAQQHGERNGALTDILHRQNGKWVIGANVTGLPAQAA